MAGLSKFLGGVVSGGVVAALTLVVASQLSEPTGSGAAVPEQASGGVTNPQPTVPKPVEPEPELVEAEVPEAPVVEEDVAEQAAPPVVAEPEAEVPEASAEAAVAPTAEAAPDVAASETPAEAPEVAEVATPEPAPAVEPPAEAAQVALPETPPAQPITELPAQAQAVPESGGAAPAPQAEAAATLTAQLQSPPAVTGTDAAPAAAELPPPPPLTAAEEAILAEPVPVDPPAPEAVAVETEAPVPAEAPDAEVAEAMVSPVIPSPTPPVEPVAEAAPAPLAEQPEAETAAPEVGFAEDGPSTLPATPRLITAGEGSLIDRDNDEATVTNVEAANILPEVSAEDETALQRFAADFQNPDNKPLFGIMLVDTGDASVDRQAVAALPFPVTVVIDPLLPEAAGHAALYRAGGKEVVMLASGIPDGATPADVEQTFQANAAVLPEAVAVIDSSAAAFQDDRPLSTQIVPILAEQGRGLLTWDRGLNAADQVARREGLPTAMVFRQIDAEGEDVPVMRRYLDRAAFKAAQEGEAIVVGTIRPETVAALLEWAIEGRASTVALAPVSALLTAN
jgi:uncharacterized protein